MPEFDKWWNDLKKHRKRLRYWLPHWQTLAARVGNGRLRYFTLCARPMIDVFMLVREGLLEVEPDNNSINRVRFCECDQEQFDEIGEMIGREDAGFYGRLEDVALFEDDDFTRQFPTLETIGIKLDEDLPVGEIDRLQLKRASFNLKSSFPYDCVNLDFCQYYYPQPPDMLRVNQTVERFLDWQRASESDRGDGPLQEFILTVTCRHDLEFPKEAEALLTELIQTNCTTWPEYKDQVESSRGITRVEDWLEKDREDFFLAGWPKDIARSAQRYDWSMEILDYVYYRRPPDKKDPYAIACLVARFSRTTAVVHDSQVALYALDPGNRQFINEIDRNSTEGQQLLQSLGEIVAIHNDQARRKQRPELPNP